MIVHSETTETTLKVDTIHLYHSTTTILSYPLSITEYCRI